MHTPGCGIIPAGTAGGGSGVAAQDDPPDSPVDGTLWFETDAGVLWRWNEELGKWLTEQLYQFDFSFGKTDEAMGLGTVPFPAVEGASSFLVDLRVLSRTDSPWLDGNDFWSAVIEKLLADGSHSENVDFIYLNSQADVFETESLPEAVVVTGAAVGLYLSALKNGAPGDLTISGKLTIRAIRD